MSPESFATRLKALTPSKEQFFKLGYSNSMTDERLKDYDCKPSKYEKNDSLFIRDNLLLLLQNYDCSNVQIGVVNFADKVVEKESFFYVGEVESDILSLNKVTQEIQVLDHENLDWVIWDCAANGDLFLNAILKCAEFFSKRILDLSLVSNTAFTRTFLDECTYSAGGLKYIEFYKMILGYDE